MSDATILNIPLGGGLDESVDDAFVPATRMRSCVNVVFPDANTCTKRPGLVELGTLANGRRLAKRRDEVLVLDGLHAWAWSPAANVLVDRGPMSPCVARQLPLGGGSPIGLGIVSGSGTHIAPISYAPPNASLAEANGFRVALWCDGTSVISSVYDVANKTFTIAAQTLNPAVPASQPRVFILGTNATNFTAYAVYYSSTTGQLVARTLPLYNITAGWSGETTLLSTTVGALALFDVSPIVANNQFGILWLDDGGGASVKGYVFSSALAVVYSTTIASLAAPGNVTACALQCVTTDNFFTWAYAKYNSGTSNSSLYVGTLNLTLSATTLAPTAIVTTGSASATIDAVTLLRKTENSGPFFFIGYSTLTTETGSTVPQIRYATTTQLMNAATAALVLLDTTLAVQLMSKFFCVSLNGSNHYFWLGMTADQSQQPTSILYHYAGDAFIGYLPLWLPAATLTPDYAAAVSSNPTSLIYSIPYAFPTPRCQDVTFYGNTTQSVYTVIGTFVSQANSTASGMFEIDFGSVDLWQSVELGKATYFAAGTPMVYDGVAMTEAGFVHRPPAPSCTQTAAGGQVPAGLITYVICYSQQDDAGNMHRSEPSTPIQFTMAALGHVTLYLVPYKTTYRQVPGTSTTLSHPLTIELYRNTQATPSVYQLVASIVNVPSNTTQTFTDLYEDASIATNPVLYTQTGQVPATPWPSLYALAVHADRVFGTDADGVTQYFTTPLEQGVAPRMAEAFTITWPEGPLTASWSLEGRLHAATSKRIHFIYGDGPNDNGGSSDFARPQLWQRDIGVVDTRSVAIAQPGVFFMSDKGLYLESRGGEFTWIGERCQRTLASASNVVTAITPLDNDGSVRFFLGSGGSYAGLHYDYRHDRWSQFAFLASAIGMVDAVSAEGTLFCLSQQTAGSAAFIEESQSTHLDNGGWNTVTLVSGWASVAEMQGSTRVQRLQLLASSATGHQLTVSTARDYSAAFDTDTGFWSDVNLAAFSLEQLRHTPTQQKCMAMSVRFVDAAPTTVAVGTGQGAVYRSVMLRTRARRGEWKRLGTGQQR